MTSEKLACQIVSGGSIVGRQSVRLPQNLTHGPQFVSEVVGNDGKIPRFLKPDNRIEFPQAGRDSGVEFAAHPNGLNRR